MLRPATAGDLPVLAAIRDAADADALSDPSIVTEADLRRLITAGTIRIWDAGGQVAGFAAVDGAAIHLLVDPAQRSKGIGRALLAWACDALREAGHAAAILTLAAGSPAERHYRAAGWIEAGRSPAGGLVLKKPF